MTADDSAYAALGLRPGADRAQVDAAYRRLMKVYHPDLAGGDADRAAEINRAYTFLRRHDPLGMMRSRPVPVPMRRRPRRGRGGWAVVLAAASAAAVIIYQESSTGRSSRAIPLQWSVGDPREFAASAESQPRFEEPLHERVIASAVADAVRFHSSEDLAGATEYSRDCHNRLRQQPNLALLDACSAFDESTLILNASGPMGDSGAFSGSEIMARELAGARAISDDIFGADSRLQRIRSQVELALLPRLDEVAVPAAS